MRFFKINNENIYNMLMVRLLWAGLPSLIKGDRRLRM